MSDDQVQANLEAPGRGRVPPGVPLVLCRCGASETKPYSDSSHRLISFRSR